MERKVKATFGIDLRFEFISEKTLSVHEDKREDSQGENEDDNQQD